MRAGYPSMTKNSGKEMVLLITERRISQGRDGGKGDLLLGLEKTSLALSYTEGSPVRYKPLVSYIFITDGNKAHPNAPRARETRINHKIFSNPYCEEHKIYAN